MPGLAIQDLMFSALAAPWVQACAYTMLTNISKHLLDCSPACKQHCQALKNVRQQSPTVLVKYSSLASWHS